jgi:hypothetical protein
MDSREASLRVMREEMLARPLAGAVFVGGMEGIRDELELVKELHPGTPLVPLAGPGGAARDAAMEVPKVSELQWSDRYPLVVRSLVAAFTSASSDG